MSEAPPGVIRRSLGEANHERSRPVPKGIPYATEEERAKGRKEASRRYRTAHRQEIRDRANRRTAENRLQINERRRQQHLANPEKRRERQTRWRAANRNLISANQMSRNHGMRPDAWLAAWEAQGGLCYLCGDQLVTASTHVDHDHACCPPRRSCPLCRRGLACGKCNQLIGLAGDDPGRLERIAAAFRPAKLAATNRIREGERQLELDIRVPSLKKAS